jgi:hypothetical protein
MHPSYRPPPGSKGEIFCLRMGLCR